MPDTNARPRSTVASLVTELWAAATGGSSALDPNVGFVSAGGHSLAAARLLAGITRHCGVRVPLSRLIRQNWTLAQLVAHVSEQAEARRAGQGAAHDEAGSLASTGGGSGPGPAERPGGPTTDGPAAPAARAHAPGTTARAVGDHVPLAPSQQRLWAWHRILPELPAYNVVRAVHLRGRPDIGALRAALSDLVVRHEALRCRVVETLPGVPELCLEAPQAPALAIEVLPAGAPDSMVDAVLHGWADVPIPMDHAPLFRVGLAHAPTRGESWIVLVLHHLIADHRATEVLLHDLAVAYAARAKGQPPFFPASAPSLFDHAEWERARVGDARWRADLAWWMERLAGLPSSPPVPLARRAGGPVFHARTHTRILGVEADRALGAALRHTGTTLAVFCMTALAGVLAAWSGSDPVVVGVPAARAARPEDDDLIGFLVDTLPVPLSLPRQAPFRDAARAAGEALDDAREHAAPPFDAIVDALRLARAGTRTPLVQVWCNDTSHVRCPRAFGALPASDWPVPPAWSLLNLGLYLDRDRHGDTLRFHLVHPKGLLDEADAAELLHQVTGVVLSAAADPSRPLGGLVCRAGTPATLPGHATGERSPQDGASAALPAVEAGQPAASDAATSTSVSAAGAGDVLPAHLLVRAAARAIGDAPAIVDQDSTLAYAELERTVSMAATGLRRCGVAVSEVVAVAARRSREAVAALLAVWRVGAVPALIDADWPAWRVQRAAALVAGWVIAEGWGGEAPAGPRLLPPLATLVAAGEAEATAAGDRVVEPDAGPYRGHILFTSGTTGAPLGVRVGPGPLEWFLVEYRRRHRLGPSDRVAFLSGPAHDPALRDILAPLVSGASLWIPPGGRIGDPQRLRGWLRGSRITVLHGTPLLLSLVAGQGAESFPELRLVVSSGAPLPTATMEELRRAAPAATVVNGYGCTETPQLVTAYTIEPGVAAPSGAVVPVGEPWPGCRVEVRDDGGTPLPVGQRGVVWVAAPRIADGYVAGSSREAAFVTHQGRRWFRTGDLARWDSHGLLHLAGRSDRQVLVNGTRLELEEVENLARTCPGVIDAAAAVLSSSGADVLRLAVQVCPGTTIEPEQVRGHLAAHLPAACVPAEVVVTGRLLAGPNLKPDPAAGRLPAIASRYAPSGEPGGSVLEVIRAVVERWAGRPVTLDENFFDAGLTSLSILQLHAELTERHRLELPVLTLFEYPNLAALAERLNHSAVVPERRRPRDRDDRSARLERERRRRTLARETASAATAEPASASSGGRGLQPHKPHDPTSQARDRTCTS